MTAPIEQSLSEAEVCVAMGVSRRQIAALIRDGRIGYSRGQRNTRRFFAEHVAQIRAALEVKPAAQVTDLTTIPGTTARGASRRRA